MINDKQNKDRSILFRVTSEEDARIKRYADLEHKSVSAFIRLAVQELINKRRAYYGKEI